MIEHMFAVESLQPSLFGGASPGFDPDFTTLSRVTLDAQSWLDYAPGWLEGDIGLFETLTDAVEWEQPDVPMFERMVRTPRLVGSVDRQIHPILEPMVDTLSDRYRIRMDRISAGWYRGGSDSVAWHGDRIARQLPHSIVATVSLGGPRRFLIRPKGGGESRAFSLGSGDLVVMGGACQRLWEHTVPKAVSAPPRIALMFRHSYD
jgi:alkylated DNA repair dioxygenase AlkB